jgi:AcrR family transcriptional regulator
VETTRNRILDVAERLFAARGIENVSLREVTSAAGVNLAAVHYHLGSREELLRAILVRRMTPLLEQRQRRLERVARKGARNARLEQIVRAFVEPSMEYDCSTDDYLMNRLITRLAVYERRNRGDLIHIILAEANDRFIAALAEVLPQLDCERLGYRFEFMVGLVTHATVLRNKLSSADQPVHGITDARRLEAELITAIVAQFLAG